MRAEAERQVRAQAPAGADVDRLVERVVKGVLDRRQAIALTPGDAVVVPDQLRRADGVSVYEVAAAGCTPPRRSWPMRRSSSKPPTSSAVARRAPRTSR